jgi:hypothetical protein
MNGLPGRAGVRVHGTPPTTVGSVNHQVARIGYR